MALDLGRWIRDRKRDVEDVFSANTPRDQQRRIATGQPASYQQQRQQMNAPVRAPMQAPMDRRNVFQKTVDQLNPLDNNRTWANNVAQNDRSIIGQGAHNGITNAVGDTIVKPFVINPAATGIETARLATAAATGNIDAGNASAARQRKNVDESLTAATLRMGKAGLVDLPVGLFKQTAGDLTDNPQASRNANDQVIQAINKTPVGQLLSPLQHKLAEQQVKRDLPNLSPDQQRAAIVKNKESAGLDPNASLGKQSLDTALGAAQLYGAAKAGQMTRTPKERPVVTAPSTVSNVEAVTRPGLRITEKLSPDRQIRKVTNAVEQGVNKVGYKASVSQNPIARYPARFIQGFSREFGAPEDLRAARRQFRGTAELGKVEGKRIAETGLDQTSNRRVWATLDPAQAKKAGYSQPPALLPEEVTLRNNLKQSIDETTAGNLERKLITEKQARDHYITRDYEFNYGSDGGKVANQTRAELMKQYKGRKDVTIDTAEQAITDPAYLVGRKRAQSAQAWAHADYGNFLDGNGYTSAVPQKGMVQLPDTPLYGSAKGKWVAKNVADDFTGFRYANETLNTINDLLNKYDNLGIRRAKKQLLTVFSPAVRIGNQVSNRVFSFLNGHNPIEFERAFRQTKGMIKSNDPTYLEAVQQGLMNTDITKADFTRQISQYIDDPKILDESGNWFQKTYSQADDRAKLASYKIHRENGLTPEQAARQTQRGFQDYNSVGFFYDMAAKTPLIGNAFVRFAGDSMRIGKNALLDHPTRTATLLATYNTINNVMSRVSGESEQDRATRENRFGAPKIPFTDISLETQTPWGAVNVARFSPFYQLNEVGSNATRFLPVQQSPVTLKDGKPQFNGGGFNDPLLGQAVQLAADRDFRNKSIRDPKNTIDEQGNKRYEDKLPAGQQRFNVGRFLATQNLPMGREIDTVGSAAKNTTDIYGKGRSLPQALLRAGGIKVEQYGAQQAQKQRETEAFFKERTSINEAIAKLPKGDQEAYRRLSGYSKLREQVPNEFEPGKMRDKKAPQYNFSEDKWKDYVSHPDVYNAMVIQKKREAYADGKPIQPEFDERLSAEFRKQLINNKSVAPGEDAEADQRMYSNPEWDKYMAVKKEYEDKAKQYYPKGDQEFVDELVKNKDAAFPEKGAAYKAYGEAWDKYNKGQGPKPAFNDQIEQEKQAYSDAQLNWTNQARQKRGLPAISKETWENVSFGFESDEEKIYKELKYGKGFGGGKGGSGGGSGPKPGSEFKYAVDLQAGGKIAKPTVKAKGGKGKVAKAKTIAKPKVTLKKARV